MNDKTAKDADDTARKSEASESDDTSLTSDLDLATVKLTKALREASENMHEEEARFLADAFETNQRERIRAGNRVFALKEALDEGREISPLIEHFHGIQIQLEQQIGAALKRYTENHDLGSWMMAQKGVGPLIAARLLAFIDWENCDTPSRIWSFAGLIPGVEWKKGEKRPWNARLKRLCFLLGESFVKTQGKENAFYPDMFTEKKRELWLKNASGGFADRAEVLIGNYKKTTESWRWYNGDVSADTARMFANKTWPTGKKPWADEPGSGVRMLPPAQIHAMARRWTVKMFIAHCWEEDRELRGITGWTPYAIDHLSGHSHKIERPGK